MLSIFQEGKTLVAVIFSEETSILLDLRHVPETGLEYLIAWILTDLPVGEALDRLLELNDTWFGERLAIVGELLSYNLAINNRTFGTKQEELVSY